MIVKAFADGRVVPFLGAGVNLCGRPQGVAWTCEQTVHLPSGSELARHLANEFSYPPEEPQDLARVSEFVALKLGSGPLYSELHQLFDADYPPTALHRFLASVPAVLREKGYPPCYPVIVTTNYDDVMERAFREAGQPFDTVAYVADGEHRGKFMHWPPEGTSQEELGSMTAAGRGRFLPWPAEGKLILVETPNEYRGLPLEQRPVILKIHGAVDRVIAHGEGDSYVITEDHYIDYLTRTDVSNLMPVTLLARMRRSHFLFLGYSLSDWNLRVILHRIWGERKLSWQSWAIRRHPAPIEEQFWDRRGVDIIKVRLEDYVGELSERLQALPCAGGAS
jgi:hypothetical protein